MWTAPGPKLRESKQLQQRPNEVSELLGVRMVQTCVLTREQKQLQWKNGTVINLIRDSLSSDPQPVNQLLQIVVKHISTTPFGKEVSASPPRLVRQLRKTCRGIAVDDAWPRLMYST